MSIQSTLPVDDIVGAQLSSAANASRFADAVELFSHAREAPKLVEGYPSFAPHLLGDGHTGYSEAEIASMERDQANGFYWPARNRTIGWLLARYFPHARRILDIGCGTGYVTSLAAEVLPNASLYATDTSVQGLEVAARKLRDRAFLIHLDASDLPFGQAFDLITTFDVLEHIEDDSAVLEQTWRSLRPGGGVLHFVPQHPSMYSPADRESRHFRRYGRNELQRKLEAVGFDVVYSTSFICWLFPLFIASRAKSMVFGSHSHSEEHGQPAWVANILQTTQAFEFSLLKQGWRYPFGVSRAVVAFRR
jgi:ubiquinone/menaquinone biosynthesis C-methylase UbiE